MTNKEVSEEAVSKTATDETVNSAAANESVNDKAVNASVSDKTANEGANDAGASCSGCSSQASCSSAGTPGGDGCGSTEHKAPQKLSTHTSTTIKHVIAVVSGKGGVGKSLVTSQIASALHAAGNKVGILDADITGPSMAHAFGIDEKLRACADGIIPSVSADGIQMVSTNLVLPEDTTPVLWRGSIISGLVRQFYSEVLWGELDYLVIDMPPGTGDVPLTVYQSLEIDGVVIVTAPQDLVAMIVGKSVNMAKTMGVPVLGIVQNMAYFPCPDCGSHHFIFGECDIDKIASEYDIKLATNLPINPDFARAMDAGRAYSLQIPQITDFVSKLFLESCTGQGDSVNLAESQRKSERSDEKQGESKCSAKNLGEAASSDAKLGETANQACEQSETCCPDAKLGESAQITEGIK
ncbi:MAG: Mrp/NBP35 family ATP-binding protein [Coriobacteriales bacterium]|nr:Mrp/NBP35 family ATP-binding protein [Coriobacteriales bacterium]